MKTLQWHGHHVQLKHPLTQCEDFSIGVLTKSYQAPAQINPSTHSVISKASPLEVPYTGNPYTGNPYTGDEDSNDDSHGMDRGSTSQLLPLHTRPPDTNLPPATPPRTQAESRPSSPASFYVYMSHVFMFVGLFVCLFCVFELGR